MGRVEFYPYMAFLIKLNLSTKSPISELSTYFESHMLDIKWTEVTALLLNVAKYFGKGSTTHKLCYEIINLGNQIISDGTLTGKAVFIISNGVFYDNFGANSINLRRLFVANRNRMHYDAVPQ